jgi:hypothetical protein
MRNCPVGLNQLKVREVRYLPEADSGDGTGDLAGSFIERIFGYSS